MKNLFSFATVVALFMITSLAYAGVDSSDIVAIYEFENTTDSGSSNLHGVFEGNMARLISNGKNGMASAYRGSDSRFIASYDRASVVNAITIATWIRFAEVGATKVGLDIRYNMAACSGAKLSIGKDYIVGEIWSESASKKRHAQIRHTPTDRYKKTIRDGIGMIHCYPREGIDINDGEWHHVVFTADSQSHRIYIDGKLLNDKRIVNTPRFYSRVFRPLYRDCY